MILLHCGIDRRPEHLPHGLLALLASSVPGRVFHVLDDVNRRVAVVTSELV